jgi:iron(III) transport system substrate-binding protein
MKRIIYFIITIIAITAVSFAVIACASSNTNRTDSPGGTIMIYTSMYGDVVENIQSLLTTRFPNIDIQFSYGGTGTLQARITQEAASGRLGCDILLIAEPSYSLELKESGMLHSYMSPHASALAFDYDPEGYWYPVRISNMVLAFNPLRHPRTSVPNSFNDFARNQNVRGLISMSNPLTSGTTLAAMAALGERYGNDYFAALGRQNVQIDYNAIAISKLESGEYRVIMILEESILQKREEEGSALEVIYPTDGTIVIPSTIMIVNDRWSANRNISAAEEITDWFLSAEGQNAIVAGWMHSVRTGFERLPYNAIPTAEIMENTIPVNWQNVLTNREEIRTRFEEYVIYN